MEAGEVAAPRGRQAEARRNDERILAAARDVFMESGPDAPVSVIAGRAGVGIATLYRRYPAKEDLVRETCAQSMRSTIAAAESALAEPEAWAGFVGFMERCLELKVAGLAGLAGTFRVTDEVATLAGGCREAIQALVDRAQADGPLRPGVTAADVTRLLQQVQLQIRLSADPVRAGQLARRYLAVILDGLCGREPLPGVAAAWDEDARRWEQPDAVRPEW